MIKTKMPKIGLILGFLLSLAPGKLPADGKELIPAELLQSDAVETAKILDANVTIAKVEDALKRDLFTVSLDPSDNVNHRINVPFALLVEKAHLAVSEVLSTVANFQLLDASETLMTDGSANLAAAIGSHGTITPTAGNAIAKDASLNILTDSSGNCDGTGKILAVIHYKRT